MSWPSWGQAWGDSWGSSWGADADVELYQSPGTAGPSASLLSAAWVGELLQSPRWAAVESSTVTHGATLLSARGAAAFFESSTSTDASLLSSYAARCEVSE